MSWGSPQPFQRRVASSKFDFHTFHNNPCHTLPRRPAGFIFPILKRHISAIPFFLQCHIQSLTSNRSNPSDSTHQTLVHWKRRLKKMDGNDWWMITYFFTLATKTRSFEKFHGHERARLPLIVVVIIIMFGPTRFIVPPFIQWTLSWIRPFLHHHRRFTAKRVYDIGLYWFHKTTFVSASPTHGYNYSHVKETWCIMLPVESCSAQVGSEIFNGFLAWRTFL